MEDGFPDQGNRSRMTDGAPGDITVGMRQRRRSSWSPAGSSISVNRGYRAPGSPGGRDFAPTEHLAAEAVAAFVDGELGMTPHMRAAQHLSVCSECAAAVEAQTQARTRLRASGSVSMPESLLGQLSQIPTREFDVPGRGSPLAGPGFPVHGAQPEGPHAGDQSDRPRRTRGSRWWGR